MITAKKFLPLLLLVLVIFVYFPIYQGFFQQDEWLGFARLITYQDYHRWEIFKVIFIPYSAHYTPLSLLNMFLLFSVFHLNYQSYAITSILLHFINSILVFYLVKILFKNYMYGLLAALLFIIMAAGFQTTAWPVADIATHGATIFGLLTLIFSLMYIEKNKNIYLELAICSLIISLLFKEITIALIVLIPLFFYFFSNKKFVKTRRVMLAFIFTGLVYAGTRVAFLLTFRGNSLVATSGYTQQFSTALYNLITFPAKAFSQTIFPQGLLLKISRYLANQMPDKLTGEKFTSTYNLFVEQKVLEGLSLIIFLVFGGVILYFWKSYSTKKFGKILGFSFLFVLLNSLIFVFSPERSGVVNIIDSRNLYFLSIGTILIILALLNKVCKNNITKIIFILLPVFMINLSWLNYEVSNLVNNGIVRKNILYQIKNYYPKLPQKVIFYTKSDYAYYGLSSNETILPFQSGLGQTLLVWYEESEKFPKEFYSTRFLWDIKEQGYYENNTRGFGYFRDYSLLKENMIKYHLPIESVIAFSWQSKTSTLTNITEKIQKQLNTELKYKN